MRVAAAALLCAASLAGTTSCGGDAGPPTGLADSTYVQVMARLSLVDSAMAPAGYELPKGLSRDSARALVLRRWGVTDTTLVAFADAQGVRPNRMQDLWTRIRQLADSLARAHWTPDGAGST